jgi:putative flavoprotein involved in K+ transport
VRARRRGGVACALRGHYDRLHLHTTRTLSDLPGSGFSRRHGRWVPRDGVVSYLENYAERNRLDVRFDTAVLRLERRDGGWLLPTGPDDEIAVDQVVIVTGYNRRPFLPAWKGRDEYMGNLLHAASYRSPEPCRDKQVLVVGAGNSGAEIAVDRLPRAQRHPHSRHRPGQTPQAPRAGDRARR